MKVAIGSDHAGFALKSILISWLEQNNFEVLDVGTNSTASVDYPDFAQKVAMAVSEGAVERGIVLCGSGVGVNIAANKINGIRASVCHDTHSAQQGVEHDDMNVLALGARIIGESLAKDLVRAFLAARFIKEERFIKRVNKIISFEKRENHE